MDAADEAGITTAKPFMHELDGAQHRISTESLDRQIAALRVAEMSTRLVLRPHTPPDADVDVAAPLAQPEVPFLAAVQHMIGLTEAGERQARLRHAHVDAIGGESIPRQGAGTDAVDRAKVDRLGTLPLLRGYLFDRNPGDQCRGFGVKVAALFIDRGQRGIFEQPCGGAELNLVPISADE